MVRDVFRLAKENAPAIIFIDEIDAIATKRFDAQTGGAAAFTFTLIHSLLTERERDSLSSLHNHLFNA